VVDSTAAYEAWLGSQVPLWGDDLAQKHGSMAAEPFAFLRATFYRWSERFPRACPEEAAAPAFLVLGDLHVENFGTWRDADGRLVWGVNDFDEVAVMPYTIDLVRLATSARLALRAGRIDRTAEQACDAILDGYTDGIEAGGRPLVLAENDRWLRRIATAKARDPVAFWAELDRLPALDAQLRPPLRRGLVRALPQAMTEFRLLRRRAGLGSLGRERVLALGPWRGASVAREVKSVAASAWTFAAGIPPEPGAARALLKDAIRCPDPWYLRGEDSVVRRLGPDCSRVRLSDMPDKRDDPRLLRAMGWETANIHLAHADAQELVRADLEARPTGWLVEASRRMMRSTMRDWKEWRAAYNQRPETRRVRAAARHALLAAAEPAAPAHVAVDTSPPTIRE
jgi:hypothetical protein